MPDPGTSRKAQPHAGTRDAFRLSFTTDPYAAAQFLYQGRPDNALSWAFHGPLCSTMQTSPYAEQLYLAFRGSFKTSLITVVRNVQRILAPKGTPSFAVHPHGPNVRILLASAVSGNAEQMLGGIQTHLKHPMVLWAFPEVLGKNPERDCPTWNAGELRVMRSDKTLLDNTVTAVGITTELTSQHYDHGAFDDVVAKENSGTKEAREGVGDFMRRIEPLFDPGATRTYVGTPWHYADYWSVLISAAAKGRQIGLYRQPAWQAAPPQTPGAELVPGFGWVRATFPERFPLPWLLAIRERAGSAFFSSQYLLDPVSRDTAYFKREKLHLEAQPPPLDQLWIVMAVDPASSVEKWANSTGIVVGGFDRTGDLWILEIIRCKRDDEALVRLCYDLQARFPRFMAVGFEAMGFAKTYRRLFVLEGERRGFYLNIVGLSRTSKRTKNDVIAGLQAPWEAGHLHALTSCQDLAAFLDEADTFRPDSESKSDDLLDACVDLYELRARPSQKAPPPAIDPDAASRLTFEQDLRTRKPGIDSTSLRIAWVHHQERMAAEEDREASLLGTGRDDLIGL